MAWLWSLFSGSAALVGLAAQPPKEKEDPKGTVKKKIVIDDDSEPTKKGPAAPAASAPDVRLDELVKAAQDTRDPTLKTLFSKYAVPFDRITEKAGGLRIQPVPVPKTEWPDSVGLVPLDAAGKPQEIRSVHTGMSAPPTTSRG